jgi:hypothetical protein
MKRRLSLFLTLAGAACVALSPILAQEHPEHPTKQQPKKAEKEYSTADLEKAIKAEVARKSENGAFELYDPELKKTWSLKLDKVHTDRLSKLSADTYFACVDMKDENGQTIDVDFFLESKDGKLEMTDTTVHKIEGKARYKWEEKDGFWKRVPLEND